MANVTKPQKEANLQKFVNEFFSGAKYGEDLAEPVKEPPRSGHVWRTLISIHPVLWGFRYRSNDEWAKKLYNTSLAFVVAEMRKLNTCNITHRFPQQPVTPNDVLTQCLFCSPVHRQLALDAAKTLQAHREDEKTHNHLHTLPKSSYAGRKASRLLGFKTCLLLSHSGARIRWDKMKKAFNECEEPTALNVPFTLHMEGFNLHHRCRRVFCLDQLSNYAILLQSIDRVHSIGQTASQQTTRHVVHNTFSKCREASLIQKTTEMMSVTLPGWGVWEAQGAQKAKAMALEALCVNY